MSAGARGPGRSRGADYPGGLARWLRIGGWATPNCKEDRVDPKEEGAGLPAERSGMRLPLDLVGWAWAEVAPDARLELGRGSKLICC